MTSGSSFVELRSVGNVRDLGGIVSGDGRVVRPGILLRGAGLESLSRRDAVLIKP